MANPIPDNYPRVSVALCVDDAGAAIEFYKKVLGATERMRVDGGDGNVGHSELTFGDSLIMVYDEHPDMNVVGPKSLGGTPVSLNIYVEDVDATYAVALDSGATELRPLDNQFYGDRSGQFEDPWGHRWNVASHVEDIDPDELKRRAAELMGG